MSLDSIDGAASGLTAQLNLQFTGAYAKQFHIGSHLSTIEIGGKFRNEHKFDNSFTPSFDVDSGTTILPLSQFPSVVTNNNYYDGSYKLGPNPGYRDILRANTLMPGPHATPKTPAQFRQVEKVSAGYVMVP
jgi:hypothetical protein